MFSGNIEVSDRTIFAAFSTIISDSHCLDRDLPIYEAEKLLGMAESRVKLLNDSFIGIKATVIGDTELKVREVVSVNVAIVNYLRVVGRVKKSARNI